MAERTIDVAGIEIWTEDFGDPATPVLLLIAGTSGDALQWTDELCTALAGRGRYVIRYDNRDSGRSAQVDYAAQPYTLSDLADDALAVLDAYDIAAAHLIGLSLGGMIAQQAAIDAAERVMTLTSIMSTTEGRSLGDNPAVARGNHARAVAASPDRAEALRSVRVPALVIHGSADEVLSPEHGVTTGKALPGSSLMMLDGLGHEISEETATRLVSVIAPHTMVIHE